jgi:hypothetical protein
MILDTIQNINHYTFGGLFNNAFQWLSQNDVEHMQYLVPQQSQSNPKEVFKNALI